MLIVIEGLDGSGKSTQVRKVSEYLSNDKGVNLRYIHFPRFDAPVVGDMIARFLRGEFGANDQVHPRIVAYLFAEDRNKAAVQMREWLAAGDVVLLDRYVYSNIAFQCAKIDSATESEELAEWILKTEYEDFGIPRPDLNIYLDVPISFVDDRLKNQRDGDDREYLQGAQDIHEADMEFQKKVRDIYLDRCSRDSKFIKINCSDTEGRMMGQEEIFTLIREQIDRVI